MRKLLLASALVVLVSMAAGTRAQPPADSDPLAIGGKDTAWFMSRVNRPDLDSEPQEPFNIVGNVYYVGADNIRLDPGGHADGPHPHRHRDPQDGRGRVPEHGEASASRPPISR